MFARRLAAVIAAAAMLFGATALPAPPARALSCVGVEDVLKDAKQVFAGEIVDANDGRILVAVDEVWRGSGVEDHVWLRVDLAEWSEWAGRDGSIPDGYASSSTWVFAPTDAAVNPCAVWRMDGDLHSELSGHRPDTPAQPVRGNVDQGGGAAPSSGSGGAVSPLEVFVAGGLLAIAAISVWRKPWRQ